MKLIRSNIYLLLIIFIGVLLRIVLNAINFSPDAESFVIWAKYLTQNRIADLYINLPAGYLPYPPVYYYILWIFGFMINIFRLWNFHWLSLLIVKIPVILSDITVTILIYKISSKWQSKKVTLLNSAFYFLNPAVIYVTSIWGQIDSIVTMVGMLCLYLFSNKNYLLAGTVFTIGLLIKLQTFALVPLFLYLVLINHKKIKICKSIFIIIGLLLLITFPLIKSNGIFWVLKYFFMMPNQYPYTSIYAYNLWSIFGFIVSDKLKLFGFIEIRYIGILLLIIITGLIIYLLNRRPNINYIYFVGFLLFFAFAFFPTRIHSRYLIYTIGFFSPYYSKYPLSGCILTLLMLMNLLLPNPISFFQPLSLLLNQANVIYTLIIFTFVYFIYSLYIFMNMVYEK